MTVCGTEALWWSSTYSSMPSFERTSRSTSARNVQWAPVVIFSFSVSWRSFGTIVTSSLSSTPHHSWNLSSSRWCWRSRGQCSPRPSWTTSGFAPWISESLCGTPFSSGSSKSGNVSPSRRFFSIFLLSSLGSDAGDGELEPLDARQRRDVERAALLAAPGEVVRGLGEAQRAEVVSPRGEHPDATRAADVEVSLAVDLEPVDRVLAGRFRHVVEDGSVREVAGLV